MPRSLSLAVAMGGAGGFCPWRVRTKPAGLRTESVRLKTGGVKLGTAFLNHGLIREQITYV